ERSSAGPGGGKGEPSSFRPDSSGLEDSPSPPPPAEAASPVDEGGTDAVDEGRAPAATPRSGGTGDWRLATGDSPTELDRSHFYSPVVKRMASEHGLDLRS